MTYKKTWLSCLLWAAFTCAAAALLSVYIISFWKSEINAVPGIDTVFAVFGAFALIAGFYLMIRAAVHKIGDKCKVSAHTIFLWELFVALCIFFAGLLYRIHLILQNGSENVDMTSFYQQATLKAGESVAYMEHGMSYLYTLCLSFVLSFLGNKVTAGVWMQVLLQMLTVLFGFLAVRKTVGKISACVAMAALAFLPVYAEQIFTMTPEVLYLFLYLLGLLIVGGYVKNYCKGQFNIPFAVTGAVICGIVIGVFSYLDAFSLTLLVFMACLFIGIRTEVEDNRFRSGLFSGFIFFLVIAAGGLTVLGGFALDAYTNGETVIEQAEVWINLYRNVPDLYSLENYGIFAADGLYIDRFLMVLSASFLSMAFWSRKKIQNVSPWFVLMLLLNSPAASIGVLEYNVCNLFVWSVLAGAGLQLSLTVDKEAAETTSTAEAEISPKGTPATEPIPAKTPATEPISAKMPATKSESPIITVPAATEEALVAEVAAISAAAEAASGEMGADEVTASMPVAEPEKQSVPTTRFLDNPLPLPKKHEKKVMDYQYEIPEEKMKFDIEIAENDDFDIK